MREYEPKITIGTMLAFEKMTGVKSLQNPDSIVSDITCLTALLFCSIKHQFPKLSYNKFLDELKPEELGAALDKVTEELVNFFQKFRQSKEASEE